MDRDNIHLIIINFFKPVRLVQIQTCWRKKSVGRRVAKVVHWRQNKSQLMVSTRRRHERDATSTPPPLATAPSTPTSPVSSSSKRQSHPRDRRLQVLKRNARSVDENIDRELVGILLSAKRFLKFTDACTGLEHILGNPGSNLRKRVWNR